MFNHKIYRKSKGALLVICLIVIFGCSTKKNTFTSRAYHNLTTHYNVFWNGRESFRTGIADLDKTKKENYNKILPVNNYGSKEEISKIASNLDRALEKGGLAIPKHSMRFKGKEFNRWIDDCYLLIGKTNFYKQDYTAAKRTFEYIIQQYPKTTAEYEAILWLAKTYLIQNNYEDAYTQLDQLESRTEKNKVPYRVKREIPLVYADYYLSQNNVGTARQFILKGIEMNGRARIKTRLYYILAQIAQGEKDYALATENYKKALKGPVNYEMEFNARINMARSFDVYSGDLSNLNKELSRMLRESKNKEFQDQIYFALAELAKVDKNDSLVEKYLVKSVSSSISNNYQKSTSSIQLADWYFKNKRFVPALAYYDTTLQFLPQDYPDYYKISSKIQTLSELVKNLETIRTEDSLQYLATLPKPELDRHISKLIASYQKEVQRKLDEEREKQIEQQIASNTPYLQNENLKNISGGGWYFYNTSAISLGYSEFMRKWGQRKLEDNWRLSDKRTVSSMDETSPELAQKQDSLVTGTAQQPVANPIDPKSYLRDIPFTDKQKAESNKRIELALLGNGYIYKSELTDIQRSIASFEELIRRYPGIAEIVKVYYQLYLINKELPDEERADYYKNLILQKFEDSDYALMIKDPGYAAEVLAKQNRIETLYSETYRAFTREQYRTVLLYCSEAVSKYKNHELLPKFEYLRALSLGRTQNQEGMLESLNKIVNQYSKSPVAPLAQDILNLYSNANQAQTAQAPATTATATAQQQVQQNPVFMPQANQPVIVDSSGYSLDVNATHFMVLMLDENSTNIVATRTRLTDFITKNYAKNGFAINQIDLEGKWQMLTISSFQDLLLGMQVYASLISDTYVIGNIPENSYRLFLISADNYPKFFREKHYEDYYKVFNKLYLKK